MADSVGELLPYNGTRFDVTIDFDSDAIGVQRFNKDMTPDVFKRELSLARTFGFMSDVERLWAAVMHSALRWRTRLSSAMTTRS